MEITEVVKKGEFRTGGVIVRSSLTCRGDNTPKEMLGYIFKGLGMAGSFNALPDGTFGISLMAGNSLTGEEFREVLSGVADMVQEAFNGKERT